MFSAIHIFLSHGLSHQTMHSVVIRLASNLLLLYQTPSFVFEQIYPVLCADWPELKQKSIICFLNTLFVLVAVSFFTFLLTALKDIKFHKQHGACNIFDDNSVLVNKEKKTFEWNFE